MEHHRGPLHIKAQKRIAALLRALGYLVDLEKSFPQITQLGIMHWQFDVFAFKPNPERPMGMEDALVIEIDGKIGHSSARAHNKNSRRDAHYLKTYGLRTIRLATAWVVGKNALSDEVLTAQILEGRRTDQSYAKLGKAMEQLKA